MTSNPELLTVRGLTVAVGPDAQPIRLVEGVDLTVGAGETLGLVGESGSGKSISCLAVMGLLPAGARVTEGSIMFDGQELVGARPKQWGRIRGRRIGMVFQEPLSSLNPAFTIGDQIEESLRHHLGLSRRAARERAIELLHLVKIPAPAQRARNFPHQLSGGMAQRALIALAIACDPQLLIADEPTTALDVTVQLQILELLAELRDALGMGLILVSHDLGVIGTMAERVAVMYAGQVVETGTVREVFDSPQHPYTSALISSSTEATPKGVRLPVIPGQVPNAASFAATGCRFANRCAFAEQQCRDANPPWTIVGATHQGTRCVRHGEIELTGIGDADAAAAGASTEPSPADTAPVLEIKDLTKHFAVRRGSFGRAVVHAVDGVNLSLGAGRTLGLVGESGSGKSTVGRLALRLIEPTSGTVDFLGDDLASLRRGELRVRRRDMQMVFQDPFASLDPMMTVGQSIAEPLVVHDSLSEGERRERVAALLRRVGLDPALAPRSPKALSGGQRQRIAIARALALHPQLIICDEPVSALDVSTRSQIVNLIQDIQETDGIAFLFVAHDLSLVHHVSHDIAVMYLGRVVESGPAERVYHSPAHPYTRTLLASILSPSRTGAARPKAPRGEIPSPIAPPSGCRFRTRCPYVMEICATEVPPPVAQPQGGWSACHLENGRPDPSQHPSALAVPA